jgi:hypothetical protein
VTDDIEEVHQWVHDVARGKIIGDPNGTYGKFVRLMNELRMRIELREQFEKLESEVIEYESGHVLRKLRAQVHVLTTERDNARQYGAVVERERNQLQDAIIELTPEPKPEPVRIKKCVKKCVNPLCVKCREWDLEIAKGNKEPEPEPYDDFLRLGPEPKKPTNIVILPEAFENGVTLTFQFDK